MTSRTETLASRVAARFAEQMRALPAVSGDVAFEVAAADLRSVCRVLRDDPQFGFEQLIDVSGVDYLDYGRDEWSTLGSTATGFSRGVNRIRENVSEARPGRFAVSYQLLSIANNWRLLLRSFTLLRSIHCDVPLGSHTSMYNLARKYPRVGQEPNPYIDPEAYIEELDARERVFNLRVDEQRRAGAKSD